MGIHLLQNDGKKVTFSGFSEIGDTITIKQYPGGRRESIIIVPGPMREIANRRVFILDGKTTSDPELVALVTKFCGIGETQFLYRDHVYYQIH